MTHDKSVEHRCAFETERLSVKSWTLQVNEPSNEQAFAKTVIGILTPEVTKSLPDGWQQIKELDKAINWIKGRAEESAFLTIQHLDSLAVVGFLFLYESYASDNRLDLRLGYLLAESVWGRGLGSELIKGLVNWCEHQSDVKSLSGGVEVNNIGSIKILEKNGFDLLDSEEKSENIVFYKKRFSI